MNSSAERLIITFAHQVADLRVKLKLLREAEARVEMRQSATPEALKEQIEKTKKVWKARDAAN